MAKALKITLYSLLVLSLVFLVLFYMQNGTGAFALSNMAWIMDNFSWVDGLLYWAYALCAVAVLALIVLAVAAMVKNPKALKKAAVTVGLAVVLVVVSYLLASGAAVPVNIDPAPTAATFKLTDFFLVMTYILAAVSVLALVAGAIRNAINK